MRYLLLFTLVVFLSAFSCEKDQDPPVQEQQGAQAFGSGSGTGSGCTNLTYNGPTTDVQIETQCKLAQVYKCQGNSAGLKITCQNISDLGGSCPYC